MSNTAHGQPKLMDFYVRNPEEFKENFHIRDTLDEDCGTIGIDDSSQYFKFTTPFHPTRFVPNKRKSSTSLSPNVPPRIIGLTIPPGPSEMRNPFASPQVEYGK